MSTFAPPRVVGEWLVRASVEAYGPADKWYWTGRQTDSVVGVCFTNHKMDWCYVCERDSMRIDAQPWVRSLTGVVCPICSQKVQTAFDRVAPNGDDAVWSQVADALLAHNRLMR